MYPSTSREAFDLSSLLQTLPPSPNFARLQTTCFLINTIAHVPVPADNNSADEDDSSDEELDGTFPSDWFEFDPRGEEPPFTTIRPKSARNVESETTFVVLENNNLNENNASRILAPLLQKLMNNAFDPKEQHLCRSTIGLSIALNRMLSLSTRRNQSLIIELESNVESDIRYAKFGLYWKCNWYNWRTKKAVGYDQVRKFYKQLKRYNRDIAEKFMKHVENPDYILVPFQRLREFAKDHSLTKQLIGEFRDRDANANIYFSIIDGGDTVDFNGVYSAYLRILAARRPDQIPTVMSTGYEFPTSGQYGPVFKYASKVDRMIRVITASHVPLGVYYPEPNTCVLLPKGEPTLPESFIYQNRKKGNLEMSCLLKRVKMREGFTAIFSGDKPIITSIPDRAKLNKRHKTPISFTIEFSSGASPTSQDFNNYKHVAQSHFHESVWYDMLFINGALDSRAAGYTEKDCKHWLAQIRQNESPCMDNAVDQLQQIIGPTITNEIVEAANEVNSYIGKTKMNYVRSENQTKFLDILNKSGLEVQSFSSEKILLFSRQDIIDLFEDDIITPDELNQVDIRVLDQIVYDDEALSLLRTDDFFHARQQWSDSEILERLCENPLHLMFMAGDPTELVYSESHDEDIVKFGIENYDIDVEWVRSELGGDRGYASSCALQDFDVLIGWHDDYCEESVESDQF